MSDSAGIEGSSYHGIDIHMARDSSIGSAGSSDGIGIECCIFRVPLSLSKTNQMAWQPDMIPIGPYHHGKLEFQEIEEHKRRFSINLLSRTNQGSDKLQHFVEALKPMEQKIRRCYFKALPFNSDELIKMMIVDGCFIIELFCKYCCGWTGHTNPEHDPLLRQPWILPFLMRDLIKLENQIPWFILECLFDLTLGSCNESHPSLSSLTMNFFNHILQIPEDSELLMKKFSDREGEHLLNLLRLTLIPDSPETKQAPNKFLHLIQPAKNLHRTGLKFKPISSGSFLDIKFINGVLEIPVLRLDDFLSSLFLNFIAFEQCHRASSKHVSAYAVFMACLLNRPADARLLCDCKILENYFGTDENIIYFFSNIGKDLVFDVSKNYLSRVFHDVNVYSENKWRVQWADFKNTYFSTRWSLISAAAAFMLLVLTTLQTFFAVYAYYRPPS
ncbi:hypothetical protein BT93_H0836 [Corymbia citriodora subsp. variegata]|nr:hypothetical protein BT93_H0836 [Corymbia citriodora subsp. variegata]